MHRLQSDCFIFYVFPFFQNFWFSFNDVNKFNMATFNGIENYKQLFNEPELLLALKNTFLYAVITVPVGLIISLVLATFLNSKIKGKGLYRTIYFLPSVTMAAAVALVWKLIFNGDYGILNEVLGISESKVKAGSQTRTQHCSALCWLVSGVVPVII